MKEKKEDKEWKTIVHHFYLSFLVYLYEYKMYTLSQF